MLALLAALVAAPPLVDPFLLIPETPMTLEVAQDPITDRVSAVAVARSGRARLAVGCRPDLYDGVRVTLEGSIWYARERLLTKRRVFVYRFDDAEPRRSAWSTDGRYALMQQPAHVPRFLAWMIASERLVVRVEDIEGRQIDLAFRLDGGRAAIDAMLRACGADEVAAETYGSLVAAAEPLE